VLVISDDALTDCDLSRVLEVHENNGAEATMVLKSVENPLDFGIVITEEDGRISRFLEKPAWGQVYSDTVNTGIYVLEPAALAEIPSEVEYDFSKELFPKLLEAGRPLYGYVTEDYWEDIGNLEQYMRAQRDVLDGKMQGVRPPGTRLRENVYIGHRAQVDDEELEGPIVIGENVRVDEGARISPYSVIAGNVVVGAGATYEGAELVDTLVGRSSYIQGRARIQERSALGDDVIVGEGATVAPDIKIFPHKTVESEANVTQSLIYETMGLRTVFKGGVVSGKFNVDLTPEFMMRLAFSFGTELDPGSIVTLGRDASRAAQVAKRAMTGALLGVGVNVRDLRATHAGVVRHDVLAGRSVAGAHVRAGKDPDDVEILFFSSGATPMSESDQRGIEKVFVREEYRRAHGADIGELIYPGRAVEQYVERLEMAANRENINAVVMEGFTNANLVRSPETPRGAAAAIAGDDPGTHFAEALDRVGRVVPTVGAAFGAVVGPTGEEVQFVDDRGEFVSPDVMLACVLSRMRPGKVVLPINLSRCYEELIREGGDTLGRWYPCGEPHGAGERGDQSRWSPRRRRGARGWPVRLPRLPARPGLLHDARPPPRALPGETGPGTLFGIALRRTGPLRGALRRGKTPQAGMSMGVKVTRDAGPRRAIRRRRRRHPHRWRQAESRTGLVGPHAPRPGQPALLRLRRGRRFGERARGRFGGARLRVRTARRGPHTERVRGPREGPDDRRGL
jgi:mannose-1-phosphate guanylyltransferase/phosphomannomutase